MIFGLLVAGCQPVAPEQGVVADPLPSWNDGAAKQAIVGFVAKVTEAGGPDFVPVSERIAVFDNDGTLWTEQPYYVQLAFAMDRVAAMASDHPEWRSQQPYRAALEKDLHGLSKSGVAGLLELIMATHSGMTTEEFTRIASAWIDTARHPRFNVRYQDLVYQPMLEVLSYLRSNGFKTFIVSGGGVEFVRPWAEQVYGIPPEQIVGSSIKTVFEVRDYGPVLVRLPEMDFLDDKEGKPVAINKHIGRRPVAAFGNSDGDLQMLEWATAGGGPRLGVIVRHTDGEREWAYDRDSHIGRLDKALDMAEDSGWTIIDMKKDWKKLFPFETE
ncbi:MAG: haloacid dehalogenase-like hydrolase [Ignavibacteria bacterium]|nr:haloacid dehalogenase-like hydrolase [Ignavibacteria bacterium]